MSKVLRHLFPRRQQDDESSDPDLRLVVGLGNPGSKYAGTRHNAGFMVAGRLAELNQIPIKGSKHRAEIGRGKIGQVPVLIALPVTYMNESGNAVRRLLDYYKVPPEHLLVIADDMDLPFATLRLRPGGSSAGQKGLLDIERSIGTSDFPRLRFGVGRPQGHAVSHVLSRFTPEQQKILPALLEKAAEAVTAVLTQGIEPAMNDFNRSYES